MTEVPLRLAGPIVRRVSSKEVHVWLMLSRSVPVRARTFRLPLGKKSYRETDVLGQSADKSSIVISSSLHMHLLRIPTASGNGYLPGVSVHYDIEVQLAKGKWTSIVKDEETCCFKGETFPSVLIPGARVPEHRIVYGSCRKLDATGRDPIPVVVDTIEAGALSKRPHTLLLIGDQIYADEVPSLLTPTVVELTAKLGLNREEMPSSKNGKVPPLGQSRRKWLTSSTRLTTGEGDNHLLTFGEFSAFYILSLNANVWPSSEALRSDAKRRLISEAQRASELQFRDDDRNARVAAIIAAKGAVDRECNALDESRIATKALSKLMANASTLMIFDDHEVTDDWNLSQQWKTDAEKNDVIMRRIVANALAAFWLFQGYGNNPDRRDSPTAEEIASCIRAHVEGKLGASPTYESLLTRRMTWHFTFSEAPPVFYLDTRTTRITAEVKVRRSGVTETVDVASDLELVGGSQFQVLEEWLSRVDASLCPIIISAVPVFSFTFLESLQDWIARRGKVFSELVDSEGWRSNPGSFLRLAQAFKAFRGEAIAVISGDLHFGFVREATIKYAGTSKKILQLTSSAIRNEAPAPVKAALTMGRDHLPLNGIQTWWNPDKSGTIGILNSDSSAETVTVFMKDYGDPRFHENSRAFDLRRPSSQGGVSARSGSIISNHVALLTMTNRNLVNEFVLDPDSTERLAKIQWSW